MCEINYRRNGEVGIWGFVLWGGDIVVCGNLGRGLRYVLWFWRLNLLRFDQWYAYKIPQNRENLIFFLLFLKPKEANILYFSKQCSERKTILGAMTLDRAVGYSSLSSEYSVQYRNRRDRKRKYCTILHSVQ
jgi:hypothetical protein